MLPVFFLYRDLYHERWGDPEDPMPIVDDCRRPERWAGRLFGWIFRRRRRRATAWSFTLPIDRRWR